MAIIDKIQISGTSYDVKDASAVSVVDITQADYDELPESAKTSNIIYNITDAPEINMNDYVSKAENVVPESWVYYIKTRSSSFPSNWHTKFAILEASSAKTGYTNVEGQVGIYHEVYGDYYYTNFNLNYVAKTASTDTQEYVTITYDNAIEDFQFTVVSDSFSITSLSLNQDINIKVPQIPITSGQSASVIKDGIEPALSDVTTLAYNNVNNFWIEENKKFLSTNWSKPNGQDGSSYIYFADDITFKDYKLTTNIKVPLTVSGWTSASTLEGCYTSDLKYKPIFRLKYNDSPIGGFEFYIGGDWGGISNYLYWDDGNQSYVFDNQYFDGTNEGVSAATFVHDSVNKTLTFTYPLTIQPNGFNEPHNVVLQNINSYNCEIGGNVIFEYYDTLEQDLIPYVQGKQDILSAGTGIDITNNVISVTGGGGGGSSYTAGYGIDIDTANTISVTGQVASSAITTAVTTASTDSEIPTAKAVNDAIAAGGGGGGGITIDPSLDTGSTNPVANSAITTAIDSKVSDIAFDSDAGVKRFLRFSTPNSYNKFLLQNFKINGVPVLKDGYISGENIDNYNLVPSSAVTSAVTSGSTDVVTSGGVYDQMGGMKIVKLTESEYAALVTKDLDTLYVVIPDPSN